MIEKDIKCNYNGYNVDIKIKHKKTILTGDSGTGKTALLEAVNNTDGCILVDKDRLKSDKNLESLKADLENGKFENKVVLIDDGDTLLNIDGVRNVINNDNKSIYVITARNPRLYNVDYKNYASVICKGTTLSIKYLEDALNEQFIY